MHALPCEVHLIDKRLLHLRGLAHVTREVEECCSKSAGDQLDREVCCFDLLPEFRSDLQGILATNEHLLWAEINNVCLAVPQIV